MRAAREEKGVKEKGVRPLSWVVLLCINVFLLVAGCFLPPVAVILMTAPTLLPIVEGLDFNAIWFGIILTINKQIGLITPPVGLNLYVINGIRDEEHPLASLGATGAYLKRRGPSRL